MDSYSSSGPLQNHLHYTEGERSLYFNTIDPKQNEKTDKSIKIQLYYILNIFAISNMMNV